MQSKILDWLLNSPNKGISTRCMAATFLGEVPDYTYPPSHPSDFNRCLEFFEWVPEARPLLPTMVRVNLDWAKVILHWDEIEQCFLDECGLSWSKGDNIRAHKTYALMNSLLK